MKRETPDPRFAKPRGTDKHPWRVHTNAAAEEKRAKDRHLASVRASLSKAGWSCPSCGAPSCDFGECTNSDF